MAQILPMGQPLRIFHLKTQTAAFMWKCQPAHFEGAPDTVPRFSYFGTPTKKEMRRDGSIGHLRALWGFCPKGVHTVHFLGVLFVPWIHNV